MQLLQLLQSGHVSDLDLHSVGINHIDTTFSRVVEHMLVNDLDCSLSFSDLGPELAVICHSAYFSRSCGPLELGVWDINRAVLGAISLHIKVSERECKLTRREDIDWLSR